MLFIKQIGFNDSIDWNALIEKSETATFFQTRESLKLWLKHFPGEPLVLGVYDGVNLIGIAPFLKRENSLQFLGVAEVLGGNKVSDFGDIITLSGREKEVWEAIINQIQSASWRTKSKIQNNRIELNFIREDSPSLGILRELGGKVEEVDVAPYLDLPATWEEYLGKLDRHNRHELRRKIRKAEEAGIEKVSNDKGERMEEFLRLMEISHEGKKNFLSQKMKNFFREIGKIGEIGEIGGIRMRYLEFEDKIIAGVMLFEFKDQYLLYNSGYDPEFSYLSAGLVMKAYMIKEAIEKGKKVFDFLRGDEKYKYDFGGKERKLYRVIL